MTIYILGDSVAAPRSADERPMHGWGDYLGQHLDSSITVFNFARSAMTTRKYFTERFPQLLNRLRQDDVVLLHFGTVDAMIHDATRFVPTEEYKEWLTLFVTYLREAGAVPVMVTPVQRHTFNCEGRVQSSRGDHPDAMREVAAETSAVLIDLEHITTELWDALGAEEVRSLFCWYDPDVSTFAPRGVIDATHLNLRGAELIGKLVARELWDHEHFRELLFDIAPQDFEKEVFRFPEGRKYDEASKVLISVNEQNFSERDKNLIQIVSPQPGGLHNPYVKIVGSVSEKLGPGRAISFFIDGWRIGETVSDKNSQWRWRSSRAFPHGVVDLLVRVDGVSDVELDQKLTFSVYDSVPEPVVRTPKNRGFSGKKNQYSLEPYPSQ